MGIGSTNCQMILRRDTFRRPMKLSTGKLPPDMLKKLLKMKGADDPRVLVGPSIGEDAAIVRVGKARLVLKTDPVTYASDMIGWYAVHVNANDIATRGAKPAWFQAVILLPEGTSDVLAEDIFKQISSAAKSLGIAVTGGHTEVTPGIDHPIVVGDMHGVLAGRKPILTSGARVGDAIVLTKAAGIEGTAAIAREKRAELLKVFRKGFVERAANYLNDPGLSVVEEAEIALRHRVSAMHDPTEGGVRMGVYELALASGKSVELLEDQVPVRTETKSICMKYDLDPLALLGSGALLATFRLDDAEKYVMALRREGITATVIGRVVAGKTRSRSIIGGRSTPLSFCERDEVLRVLGP